MIDHHIVSPFKWKMICSRGLTFLRFLIGEFEEDTFIIDLIQLLGYAKSLHESLQGTLSDICSGHFGGVGRPAFDPVIPLLLLCTNQVVLSLFLWQGLEGNCFFEVCGAVSMLGPFYIFIWL